MTSEFSLIERYFDRPVGHTALGVGDDAAILQPREGCELVASTDTLVEGVHFFAATDPDKLGHKALAVNLSDLAAMAAEPRWALLALTLPDADERWVEQFAKGFFRLALEHAVDLVGGDTTRGPRSITVTVLGEAPVGEAVRRSGARAGDDIWVSGTLGEAALGLQLISDRMTLADDLTRRCLTKLHTPLPRVALGRALRGIATAMIDVSDGLLADLGHIARASQLAADVSLAALPLPTTDQVDSTRRYDAGLAGGDDYELCFCAAPQERGRIERLADLLLLPLTHIGVMAPGEGVRVIAADGTLYQPQRIGFDHFERSFL